MHIRIITRTALLLALVIVIQISGRFMGPHNSFIVGPVVNALLIIATATAGLWSGITLACIVPLISALTSKAAIAPLILLFSPFIALGNSIMVISYFMLMKKSRIAAVAAGALLKSGFLYSSILLFLGFVNVQPNIAALLITLFGWPQLMTALIGGGAALVVLRNSGTETQ